MHYHHTSLLLFVVVEKNYFIITVIMLIPSLAFPESNTLSAAERDWVAKDQEAGVKMSSHCKGHYLPPASFMTQPSKAKNVIIVTSEEVLHVENEVTTFLGDVEVQGINRTINASSIIIDSIKDHAIASGAVSIREDGLLIQSDYGESNLSKGDSIMKNATFILHENQIRGSANQITSTNEKILTIEEGNFTRCEPGNNFWEFHGQNIELKRNEGYGVANHATVKIKGIPIAYFPYLRFPLNNERSSGFLTPSIAHNDEDGMDISIPYYLNFSPNYDATYTFRDIARRGIVHTFGARHLSRFSGSEIHAAHLSNDNRNQDLYSNNDTRQNRWSLYLDHIGLWPSRWTTALTYNAVSDMNYLQDIGEFKDSPTKNTHRNPFSSRTKNPSLIRKATLGFRGDGWRANILTRGHQNLTSNGIKQYSVLPQINFQIAEEIPPFDIALKGQFSRFRKNSNDKITGPPIEGDRFVLDSSVRKAFEEPWGFVNSELGVLIRNYKFTAPVEKSINTSQFRTPYASLDTGLRFERLFSYKKKNYLQTLTPRIYFLYVNQDYQPTLPKFDSGSYTPSFSSIFRRDHFSGYDELRDVKQISIGITTAFLDKRLGKEIFKMSIGQIRHLNNRDPFVPSEISEILSSKSSPIFLQSRLQLNQIGVNGSYEWDPEKSQANQASLSIKFRDIEQRKILNLTYSYTRGSNNRLGRFQNSEETDLSFLWPLKDKWNVVGRWNFNWKMNQTIESLVGLEYNDCCWRTRIAVRRFDKQTRLDATMVNVPAQGPFSSGYRTNTGLFFEFQLKGLSTLGERLDTLLENSISGYQSRVKQ